MARTYRKPKQPGEMPTRDLNRAAKTIMALDLAKQGKSWREIGEAVGVATRGRGLNPGSVFKMVQEELDRCITYEVNDYRRLQNERLDALLAAMWPHAVGLADDPKAPGAKAPPSTWHVDRCLAIIAQQNKLNALDVVPESAAVASVPTIREYPEGVAEAV